MSSENVPPPQQQTQFQEEQQQIDQWRSSMKLELDQLNVEVAEVKSKRGSALHQQQPRRSEILEFPCERSSFSQKQQQEEKTEENEEE